MAIPRLLRSRYFDPASSFVYLHEGDDHFDDYQDFHLPLARVHQAALHDWGVAQGLEVSGAVGAASLTITAGVALAKDGQLICLATNGHPEIRPDPAAGAVSVPPPTVPVSLPLAGSANFYLTIQHYEHLVSGQGAGGRLEQRPWIRLLDVAGPLNEVTDGIAIILAVVRVNAGTIVSLRASDPTVAPLGRRLVGQSLSELRLMRPTQAGNTVADAVSGTVAPRNGGGLTISGGPATATAGSLDLRVPTGGDNITLARTGDQNFASLIARTNSLLIKNNVGNDAMSFQSNGADLTIGGANNEGDISIRDNANAETVRLDGQQGAAELKKLVAKGGNVIDVNASYFRIHGIDLCLDGRSGGNKRALVDWTNTLVINFNNDYTNGVEMPGDLRVGQDVRVGRDVRVTGGVRVDQNLRVIQDARVDRDLRVDGDIITGGLLLGSSPTRSVVTRRLFVDNGTTTADVTFGSPRRVFAFVAMTGTDPRAGFDSGDLFAFDIFSVDGNRTGGFLNGGAHLGPPGDNANIFAQTFAGTAQTLTFRLRSFQDAGVWGIGVVFHE